MLGQSILRFSWEFINDGFLIFLKVALFMKRVSLRSGAILAVLLASLGLAGCGSTSLLETDKLDYRSASLRPTLEIPPDITKLEDTQSYRIEGAAVSILDQPVRADNGNNALANEIGDVTIKRNGNQRWLLVERSPEQLWPMVEAFWQDLGFVLVLDEPKLGIMETDWAENRAKIPQDFIRASLGKIFDSLYSTGERDKFRTRLEVTASGTEIYITHRGVEETYSSNDKTTTMWQPRPADPELEAELLRRLMVRLGVTEEQSTQAIAETQSKPARAHVIDMGGLAAIKLDENFDNAWRWVGISLDRISFTVVGRDRSTGIYQVRYVDPVVDTRETEKGLLSGLFSRRGSTQAAPRNFQIKLSAADTPAATLIQITDEKGNPVSAEIASRIMNALAKDLN